MADLWRRWHCNHLSDPADAHSPFAAPVGDLGARGGAYALRVGQTIEKGEALFMRADANEPTPGSDAEQT